MTAQLIDYIRPEFHQNVKLIVECTWILANFAHGDSQHVEFLVKKEIIPLALGLLSHPDIDVRENVIWILSNIAAESHEYRDMLLDQDLPRKLEATICLEKSDDSFLGLVSWLISNICKGPPYPEFHLVKLRVIFSFKFLDNRIPYFS